MLDLFNNPIQVIENSTPWVAILLVTLASLAGSLHCVGMCGGILMASSQGKRTAILYHLGRLAGYLFLGLIAGLLGEKILSSEVSVRLSWFSAFFIGFLFVYLGIQTWRGKHHFSVPSKWSSFLLTPLRKISNSKLPYTFTSLGTGMFSVFLPCGWLYSFVLAAVATQSPVLGTAVLFAFWLGTLPALSFMRFFLEKGVRRISSPKLGATALLLAGFSTIAIKVLPLLQETATHSCH